MQLYKIKSPWPRRLLTAVLAYLSTLSLARIISLNGEGTVYFGGNYFGYNLTAILLFAVTAWLLNRFFTRKDRRLKVVSSIGGILLGMAIVYGGYAHYANDIFRSVSRPHTVLVRRQMGKTAQGTLLSFYGQPSLLLFPADVGDSHVILYTGISQSVAGKFCV